MFILKIEFLENIEQNDCEFCKENYEIFLKKKNNIKTNNDEIKKFLNLK